MNYCAWVVGEALMDLIPTDKGPHRPIVGGGPANTAKALARLGYDTYFIGGISIDDYGQLIQDELLASGVNLSLALRSDLPTALAIATIDESGLVKYDFELDHSASFSFEESWLPKGTPDAVHIGSVATLLEPGSSVLLRWIQTLGSVIVFDPNVRPSIQSDKTTYRTSVDRWIKIATVIKMSEEDLEWLYEIPENEIVDQWLRGSTRLIIVTRGVKGLTAYTSEFKVELPAIAIDVVDTVGAGDTVGAVLLEGMLKYGIERLDKQILQDVLSRAVRAAAITCSRSGAQPPTQAEIENF